MFSWNSLAFSMIQWMLAIWSLVLRWYQSNGRKRRGIKEPLDEGEGGEWKGWLKTQYLKKTQDRGIWPHHFMANRRGKCGSSDRVPLLGFLNHCGWWLQSWNQKMIASWQEIYDKPGQCVKKQRHHFADKGLYSQSYSFSSSHVQIWELDH